MRRNAIEWIVLAVSVVAIVVLVAALLLEGLSENRPADPSVVLHPELARQGELGWIIPGTVLNAGDEPAEAVLLEARAEVAGVEEASQLELAFLPAGTTVEVAFAFSARPSGPVQVRLSSFRLP